MSRRRSGPRRRTIWSRLLIDDTSVAAGATAVFILVNASTNVLFTESTVTRIVGTIDFRMTDAGNLIPAAYALGIIAVNELALATTVAPSPVDPEGQDWMYWRNGLMHPQGLPTDSSALHYGVHIDLDLKAQRRLRENASDLVLIVSNAAAEAALGVTCGLNVLIKLP